ncbi:hypothetical protein HWD93_11105, partial [Curtobacterium sp. C2H10]|nr:hypothetical protein [Curtobacterium sp. C2H10]
MTTARELDQHPDTPVVHLSRRAALEAERAAARKPARRERTPKPERAPKAERTPAPPRAPKPERTGRRAAAA